MLRVGFGVLTGWQAARLTSTVVARTRKRLARAFLATSWEVQQDDRTGRLQELLTTFSQQAFALINSLTTATSSLFSLLALLGIAVAVDPVGALVVIVAVAVLGSLLRPVRAAVKRRGKRSAEVGMHFATSLSEVSQLGLEMHVFHVQDQTGRRVMRLIDDTAAAERRLSFAKGLVPTLYTGLAYLALVGALAAVSLSKGTSLVALGAVILVMLRSLTYGQALQAAQAGITSTMPYLQTLKSQLDVYTNGRRHDGGQAVEHVGTLEFRDVSFSYSQGHEVLRNISFSMRPREIVGIVGPSPWPTGSQHRRGAR
jgi:ABC-type multidrug transport system fused ATPase/permease subunit